MNKILIIQTAFIGDVILTLPLIELLTEKYSKPVIDFLTIPSSKNLLDNHPDINRLIIFDKKMKDKGFRGLIRVGNLLEKNRYDICLTPHRSLRSAYLSYKSKAKIRTGFSNAAYKNAFTHIIEYQKNIHEIARNLSMLGALGFTHTEIRYPKIYPDNNDIGVVERYINHPVTSPVHESTFRCDPSIQNRELKETSVFSVNNNKEKDNSNNLFKKKTRKNPLTVNLFAIAPGSIWPTKRWPLDYYEEVCYYLVKKGLTVILIGGTGDVVLCDQIKNDTGNIISLAGKLTLRQTYYLLTRCKGLLTNDSAPLHLGMAASIPVYAIFGPTVPEFGFAPYGDNGFVIQNQYLNCRPCGIHGGNECPTKTFDCMEKIIPKIVIGQITIDN